MGFTSEGLGRGSCFYIDLPIFRNSSDIILDVVKIKRQKSNTAKTSGYQVAITSTEFQDSEFQDLEKNIASEIPYDHNLRVLIVDDSAMNRKILRKMLEREAVDENNVFYNVHIKEADDGATAIDMIEHDDNQFDYIFMDYVMITMNGPEATNIIRNKLNFNGKIIGVTGNALPDDISHFIKCGADKVIVKPLTREKLFQNI